LSSNITARRITWYTSYVRRERAVILDSKGQITIPSTLRAKFNLREGDDVEVIEVDGTLRIVRSGETPTRGRRLVDRMRGTADSREIEGMSTDEIMEMLRGDRLAPDR
jgi:AbrB family looped-hinge helix DNA binding protein